MCASFISISFLTKKRVFLYDYLYPLECMSGIGMYSWSFIYVPFMNTTWNNCTSAASGALARGVCACAGVEACPRPPRWGCASLLGGVHVALPVVESFRALFIAWDICRRPALPAFQDVYHGFNVLLSFKTMSCLTSPATDVARLFRLGCK